jgi:hypothetical protein
MHTTSATLTDNHTYARITYIHTYIHTYIQAQFRKGSCQGASHIHTYIHTYIHIHSFESGATKGDAPPRWRFTDNHTHARTHTYINTYTQFRKRGYQWEWPPKMGVPLRRLRTRVPLSTQHIMADIHAAHLESTCRSQRKHADCSKPRGS